MAHFVIFILSLFSMYHCSSSHQTVLHPSKLSDEQAAFYASHLHSYGAFKDLQSFCDAAGILCSSTASKIVFNPCKFERRRRLLSSTICNSKVGQLSLDESYFRLHNVSVGHAISVYSRPELLGSRLNRLPNFLPESISLQLPVVDSKKLLKVLDINPSSPMGSAIIFNSQLCREADIKGFKDRVCINSVEQLESFILSKIGSFTSLNFFYHTALEKPLTIDYVKLVSPPQSLNRYSCHTIAFPYGAMYCHSLEYAAVFSLRVRDANNNIYDNIGISCHMNTSKFQPDHPSLRALHLKPGQGEVCHVLANSVVFIGV